MEKQLTQREINDKKWQDHWNDMVSYLKNKLGDCLFIIDEHSIGISRDKKFYQIYGAEESFKFSNNNKTILKAMNNKTGKFVKVYEYRKKEEEVRRCSQAHLIYNAYSDEEVQFIKDLRDAMIDFYKPNSIKFIMDNF